MVLEIIEEISFHPPEGILNIIKAGFDGLTVIAFIALFFIVYYAKNRYPVIGNRGFLPMLGFVILGIISTTMDFFDEFFWFTPKAFYDVIWKPTRLFLMIFGIFLLIVAFFQFYKFSDRLFGEEIPQLKDN